MSADLYFMPLLTENVLEPRPPRYKLPNFDGVICIHYAAPPYSARSSAIYLLPFGKVWLGCVCPVQRLETKQNAYFAGENSGTILLFQRQFVAMVYPLPCGEVWLSSVV